jgi:hypothetical protein
MNTAEAVRVDYARLRGVLRQKLEVREVSKSSTIGNLLGRGGSGGNISGSKPAMHPDDFDKTAYVKAIHALPEPMPAQLLGRYAQSPQADHQGEIVLPIMRAFKTNRTQWRAANMANHIIRRSKSEIWEIYGLTEAQWQNHTYRNTWKIVVRMLKESDLAALDAWASECLERGLEV